MSSELVGSEPVGEDLWLAAVLGNTHVRWGWFQGETLVKVECFPVHRADGRGPLQTLPWPSQTELWVAAVGAVSPPPPAPWIHQLELAQVPLGNLYPTLGLDRALALWAAGIHYGWPCLVIDAGTALTLTGADETGSLVGGAILPGLGLQARSLAEYTARLPRVDWDPCQGDLPPRWATNTPAAIRSGILYTVLAGLQAFIADWRQRFPAGPLLLTGGDSEWLCPHLQNLDLCGQPLAELRRDPHLVLRGIAGCRQRQRATSIPNRDPQQDKMVTP